MVGKITVDTSGEVSFDGTFWTPRSPDGKAGKDLDDTEKENLLALLHDEIDNLNQMFAYEFASIPHMPGAGNVVSSLLPVNVKVTIPPAIIAGAKTLLSASATRPWGTVLRGARYDWRISDGRIFEGKNVRVLFKQSGTFTVRLTVTDSIGTYEQQTREMVVRSPNAPPPTPGN
jgi:hypothetical protein